MISNSCEEEAQLRLIRKLRGSQDVPSFVPYHLVPLVPADWLAPRHLSTFSGSLSALPWSDHRSLPKPNTSIYHKRQEVANGQEADRRAT